ncbi:MULTISPECIES: N-acetyltransferase [unclassified Agarivorans]|uniref:N-acetyltransferase n=1 Tax=unclassified Agarivorans TaxID=2636026 RepID=UPI0026E39639|nr:MULTISPECIES: N-acetyltransferase [unclassified Agarivorans]MDO6687255.1 N-acetyltransferase [Agarivorans sp. 3_MG-2023]MDO6716818.1 N-acetyltransferase [Agarivorans sp. 2_MG-2023]
MIRPFQHQDTQQVLDIWLDASIKAHDFVKASFWRDQLDNMRDLYLPNAETYVYEQAGKVVGFYALSEKHIAAIFVDPASQGQGIGKQLIAHAKQQRSILTLAVYKQNVASYQFYLSQGFSVVGEQIEQHTGLLEYTMSTGI